MKKLILSSLCVALVGLLGAQNYVINQDFQGFGNGGDIFFETDPDNAEAEDWVNIDLDQLEDGSGAVTPRPGEWYGSLDFAYFDSTMVVDTNFVMASSSWMSGFAPGNRNYLITPEIEVTSDMVLNWKSGVFQSPRYADGYTVRVSPDADISDVEFNFSDVLFTQAQMVENTTWNADFYPGIDYSGCVAPSVPEAADACWYPEVIGDGVTGAYIHADNHTLTDYIGTDPNDAAPTAWRGFLEPHSVSLAAYAGQTIRIAILHDSDDDNLMMIDDINVELPVGVAEYTFDQLLNMYPNPATDVLNLDFSTLVKEEATVSVYDNSGRLISVETFAGDQLGAIQTLDISTLANGIYSVQVSLDNVQQVGKNFMKK